MTVPFIAYFLIGLSAMLWPLYVLLFCRRVQTSQWLMCLMLMVFGVAHIFYGCLFTNLLSDEYIIVILFMLTTAITPPLFHISMSSFTHSNGVSPRSRMVFVPFIVLTICLLASILIGGVDMYLLWIERGSHRMAGIFFDGSDRYNLIVATHYYFYWSIVLISIIIEFGYCFFQMRRYRHRLSEYLTVQNFHPEFIVSSVRIILVACLAIIAMIVAFPFNSPRPVWTTIVYTIVMVPVCLFLGHNILRLDYGSERLGARFSNIAPRQHRHNVSLLGRDIADYVITSRVYLRPDFSVFGIANHFHISEDDVVDAIHHLYHTTFAEYADALRIDHSLHQLALLSPDEVLDSEVVASVAYSCGFLSVEIYEQTFARIMHTTVYQWVSMGGVKVNPNKIKT